MELLFQGAESRIYVDDYLGKRMLIKERFKKEYRVPELDAYLTRERIKAECRNTLRCKQAGIKTPAIYFVDLDRRLIYMEYFDQSVTVKTFIQDIEKKLGQPNCNKEELENKLTKVSNDIGQIIGKMHKNNIIHGDLTTSNFLIENHETAIGDLILIDFGLSHSEGSDEDKAVDLYVLERALVSTHSCTEELFSNILKTYCETIGDKSIEVLKKFSEVRSRGRKREMIG
ncbi:UNVERIFIED_CONTAM: hypothetical protein PYX00_001578 [Menopon gallinae]|uniref:non-specific serine/threonine protein kinase n=1 Tax=Menopon gallinae TaxID=328185 RepID=A0AAW2IDA9_9NEOP